jgi:hypothetical protein
MKSELYLFAWGVVRTDDAEIRFWIFCFDDVHPSALPVAA